MSMPPLIRPMRRLMPGRPLLAALCSGKDANLSWPGQIRTNATVTNGSDSSAAPDDAVTNAKATPNTTDTPRYPRSLQAFYLQPLRREAKYGVPTCDLQLRSYSLPNLEFFADFALRAAYYAGLPTFGPVPLPKLKERWTVPKSHFIFKKSQENFERITLRRLIQIRDGNPETVQVWLAFLKKHAYYGIGMKANVWEFSKLGVGKTMDESVEGASKLLEDKWTHLAESKKRESPAVEKIEELLASERVRLAGGR